MATRHIYSAFASRLNEGGGSIFAMDSVESGKKVFVMILRVRNARALRKFKQDRLVVECAFQSSSVDAQALTVKYISPVALPNQRFWKIIHRSKAECSPKKERLADDLRYRMFPEARRQTFWPLILY